MSTLRLLKASLVPAAVAVATFGASFQPEQRPFLLSLRFRTPLREVGKSNLIASAATCNSAQSAIQMNYQSSDLSVSHQILGPHKDDFFPVLLTEYMVDMKCESCVSVVKDMLLAVEGIKSVDVDLNNQIVRVHGSSSLKSMAEALEQTGCKARLIGQGNPEDFLISAAVAEFKGPGIFGVVRFAQVSMELARIEAEFSGLLPGTHGWSINEFGDLTRGAASTGKVFDPGNQGSSKVLGDLGVLRVGKTCDVYFSGGKEKLKVGDLIGRSVVLYQTEDISELGIAAAVIARSAGVGENYKRICTCDGTTIWESN